MDLTYLHRNLARIHLCGDLHRPSDPGSQSTSIRYPELLAEAGARLSIGLVDDSHKYAMAASIIGLLRAEVISRHGPWRGINNVEIVTWMGRLAQQSPPSEATGDIPPVKAL